MYCILTHEISILKVESIELIARLLCICNIFVNNKHRTFGVVGCALADLPDLVSRPLATRFKHDMPNRTKLSEEVEKLISSNVITNSMS